MDKSPLIVCSRCGKGFDSFAESEGHYCCPPHIMSDQELKDMLDASRNERKSDMVNHPSHYKGNGIECIDAMKACVTPEEFRAHLKLTVIKYLWRYEKKNNPLEDIQKAQWYLSRLEEELKNA